MDIWGQYRAYLANNPEGYWFKRKLYGWGWVPAKWQGWLVTALYVLSLLGLITLHTPPLSRVSTETFFIGLLVSSIIYFAIAYKTGEKPRWQWGPSKLDSEPGS